MEGPKEDPDNVRHQGDDVGHRANLTDCHIHWCCSHLFWVQFLTLYAQLLVSPTYRSLPSFWLRVDESTEEPDNFSFTFFVVIKHSRSLKPPF